MKGFSFDVKTQEAGGLVEFFGLLSVFGSAEDLKRLFTSISSLRVHRPEGMPCPETLLREILGDEGERCAGSGSNGVSFWGKRMTKSALVDLVEVMESNDTVRVVITFSERHGSEEEIAMAAHLLLEWLQQNGFSGAEKILGGLAAREKYRATNDDRAIDSLLHWGKIAQAAAIRQPQYREQFFILANFCWATLFQLALEKRGGLKLVYENADDGNEYYECLIVQREADGKELSIPRPLVRGSATAMFLEHCSESIWRLDRESPEWIPEEAVEVREVIDFPHNHQNTDTYSMCPCRNFNEEFEVLGIRIPDVLLPEGAPSYLWLTPDEMKEEENHRQEITLSSIPASDGNRGPRVRRIAATEEFDGSD